MPNIGQFVLHSQANPPLKAGDYVLQGRQDIAGGQTEPYDGHVRVTAPRFALPADQLLSTFPPANSEGAYENRLPQIVLKRRTLPWERAPEPARTTTPWLALVVIAEGEGTLVGRHADRAVRDARRRADRAQRRRHRDLPVGLGDRGQQGLPDRGRPAAAGPRARGRHRRHRAGQRRRRRLPGRGHGQPPAAVRPHGRQARALPRVPRQPRGPARRRCPSRSVDVASQFLATELVYDVRVDAAAAGRRSTPTASSWAASPARRSSARWATPPRRRRAPRAARRRRDARRVAAEPSTPAAGKGATAQWSTAQARVEQRGARAPDQEEAGRVVRDVMLEGFRDHVEHFVVLEPVYRFPVLAHWSFTVVGQRRLRAADARARRRPARHGARGA